MIQVALHIEPYFCGPASVGTVEAIQLLRATFGFGLSEAKGYVDCCVFEGERVLIPAPFQEIAERFVEAVRGLKRPAKIEAEIADSV